MKIWLDGGLCEEQDAKVSVFDHGLLYGDGVFEGMRVANGKVFRLADHLRRLEHGALTIGLTVPGGATAVREAVEATVAAHGESDAYVRLVLTRGRGPLGVDPTTCPRPTLFCIVDRLSLFPAEKVKAGLELVTSSLRRPPIDVLDPRVKSLNYLNNALAKLEARKRGADDALLLNQRGTIAEAAVANLFAFRRGELLTPPTTDGALDGITRRTVLELASEAGITAREASLGVYDLITSDEVFITGSGAGLVPVRSIDQRPIGVGTGPGQLFARVHEAYWTRVHADTR
jgi:branched-chain amino acid aminotransferase